MKIHEKLLLENPKSVGFTLLTFFAAFFFLGACAHSPVSVEEAQSPARILVHANEPIGTIDPMIFGHFTELTLTSFEGGVWSEMILNRKFGEKEELERFPYPRSGTAYAWMPISYDTNISLHMDNQIYYSSPFSQRIRITPGGTGPAGVQQSGYQNRRIEFPFHFRKGEEYLFRVAVKQEGLEGPLFVALGDSPADTVAAHSFQPGGRDWQIHTCTLTPKGDSKDGKLMIYIDSPGTVWIDSVSLTKNDVTRDGFRSDVIDTTLEITPTNLRYPGGCFADDYHWKDGIGPLDQRPDTYNRAWDRFTTNDVGTDEFVTLCRMLKSEPYICVNFGTASAGEAADWVEYCNGGPDTHWGSIRAKNGHPEPYNVKYWNIGNEVYLPTEFGTTNGREYGKTFREFAKAMKAVDPSIRLVAVGCIDMTRGREQAFRDKDSVLWQVVRYTKDWTKGLMLEAGEHVDMLSLHYYEPENVSGAESLDQVNSICMAISEDLNAKLDELYEEIEKYAPPGKHIPIALDEWANWVRGGPQPPPRDYAPKNLKSPMEGGLYGSAESLRKALAEASIMNLMQRRPADFEISNITLLYAYFGGEVAIRRDAVAVSPVGLMMGLFSTHDVCQALKTDVDSPTFQAIPMGNEFAGLGDIDYVDVSSRVHPDGKTVDVFVLNKNLESDIEVGIELAGGTPVSDAVVSTLNGDEIYDWNTFAKPDRVSVKESRLTTTGAGFSHTFPAHSITKLTFEVD